MNQTLDQSFSKYSANKYFWIFITIHTLLWTIGPSLLRPSLTHDTLESMTWGYQWQLGYSKHPFLTAWLSAAASHVFPQADWPLYLLAQLAVSLTFWAAWKLANHLLSPWHALISALVLEGVLFYNINSFNFTPDTLQSPLWALMALSFYNALHSQKLRYWIYTGGLAALAICTKYQVMLLLLPMFAFCILNANARMSFKHFGIYCGLVVLALLISPHVLWLYDHQFITLRYATNTPGDYTPEITLLNHVYYPALYLLNNIGNVACVFLLLWPFYKNREPSLSVSDFQWQFLLYIGLGPSLLSIVLCIITGNYFPPRWATPYYFALGVILVTLISPSVTRKQLKQFTITLILFSLSLFIIRMSTLNLFVRPASDAFLPNQRIAATINNVWIERYHTPIPTIAGSNYLLTSIIPYIPNHPLPYLNWDSNASPWIEEKILRKSGCLFVWDKGKNYVWDKYSANHTELPSEIKHRFPNLEILPDLTFHRSSDASPVIIGVALLPPSHIQ